MAQDSTVYLPQQPSKVSQDNAAFSVFIQVSEFSTQDSYMISGAWFPFECESVTNTCVGWGDSDAALIVKHL